MSQLLQHTRTAALLAALFFLAPGCLAPRQVTWDTRQPVVGPQVPPLQGILLVYSERYVILDEGVPVIYRRPVEVYTDGGQLVASERNLIGDGPIRFALTPGHYIVASESHMRWRKIQVEIQDGRQTVVPESVIEQPIAVSSN
jgi:hypothetical protein